MEKVKLRVSRPLNRKADEGWFLARGLRPYDDFLLYTVGINSFTVIFKSEKAGQYVDDFATYAGG